MNTNRRATATAVVSLAAASLAGCFQPDYPKVVSRLTDQTYELEKQVAALKQQAVDREATIRQLQDVVDQRLPRVASLPEDRLKQLFTVGRIEIRKMTDAADFSDAAPGPDGFRVFVRTMTDEKNTLPATGELTVEAFDLARKEGTQRLGTWTFAPEQLKASWYGGFGLDHFAVNCPWEKMPDHREIVFKVRFIDALTGRVFTDQKTIEIHLPAK